MSLSNESDGRATVKLCLAQFTDEATLNEISGHTWLRFCVISLLFIKHIVTEHYMDTRNYSLLFLQLIVILDISVLDV